MLKRRLSRFVAIETIFLNIIHWKTVDSIEQQRVVFGLVNAI